MASYTACNLLNILLCAINIGLMIAAVVAPWYHVTNVFEFTTSSSASSVATLTRNTATVNSTSYYADLTGFKITVSKSGSVTNNGQFFQNQRNAMDSDVLIRGNTASGAALIDYDVSTRATTSTTTYAPWTSGALKNIHKVAQSLVLISLFTNSILLVILLFTSAGRIRNKVIYSIGFTVLKVLKGLCTLLSLVCNVVCFLQYLGVSKAFRTDNDGCTIHQCASFVGDDKVTYNFASGDLNKIDNWGPSSGWYIVVCATSVCLSSCVSILLLKYPLPLDSEASSGEAL